MTHRPLVLVVGANFVNQGAFLMLDTVSREIAQRVNGEVVVDMRLGTNRQRQSVRAATLLPGRIDRVTPKWLTTMARAVSTSHRYVKSSEISAVVDISGFRYGDQWAHLPLNTYASRLSSYSDRGVSVFMFPQAFGPFEEPGVARAALKALRASTVVFARDPDSARHLTNLAGADELLVQRIHEFPDFTGPSDVPVYEGPLAGRVPIIPNWNIIERSPDAAAAERYVQALVALAEELKMRGYSCYGLSHEAGRDEQILRTVANRIEGFDVVSDLDGVQLKGVIGSSALVVAGRFHAISSALSQGIPTLLHGWSHKYRWMAASYSAERYLVDPYTDSSEQVAMLVQMLDDTQLSAAIRKAGGTVDDEVAKMWEIFVGEFESNVDS